MADPTPGACDLVTCPECSGERMRRVRAQHTPACFSHYGPCVCGAKDSETACSTCKGDGTIPHLKACIYKARGGPSPVRW